MYQEEINATEQRGQSYPLISLTVHPGLTSEMLLSVASNQKAVVLITNAMGSVGEQLYPALQNLRDHNIPVFILPDNAGEQHGVIRIVDETQKDTEKNGGIFLEKANINNEQEVLQAIKEALDAGKIGQELGETIRAQFAYKESEEKPVSRLGTPRGFRHYTKEVRKKY